MGVIGEKARDVTLGQNYPNPFNPVTSIQFIILEKAVVQLAIYDVLGRKLTTPVHGEREAGTYRVNFDASRFASGTYFYRLEAGGFVQTKRMLLMR